MTFNHRFCSQLMAVVLNSAIPLLCVKAMLEPAPMQAKQHTIPGQLQSLWGMLREHRVCKCLSDLCMLSLHGSNL